MLRTKPASLSFQKETEELNARCDIVTLHPMACDVSVNLSQDVELGQGPSALPKSAVRRRGCCDCCRGVCSFVLAHWSKAVVLAIVITVIVLFSVRVRGLCTVLLIAGQPLFRRFRV